LRRLAVHPYPQDVLRHGSYRRTAHCGSVWSVLDACRAKSLQSRSRRSSGSRSHASDILQKVSSVSYSPSNPDAACHFCTSAREALITMIDSAAPDSRVVEADPARDRTGRGVPTRRANVGFLLRRKGIDESQIEDLIEEDIDNVLGLFREFNYGTHGHAGRFTITQLNALRLRVESAIEFIHAVCLV